MYRLQLFLHRIGIHRGRPVSCTFSLADFSLCNPGAHYEICNIYHKNAGLVVSKKIGGTKHYIEFKSVQCFPCIYVFAIHVHLIIKTKGTHDFENHSG